MIGIVRRGAPSLAQARFWLVREYWFASWPKLKASLRVIPRNRSAHSQLKRNRKSFAENFAVGAEAEAFSGSVVGNRE
jgi:hypothetical protein